MTDWKLVGGVSLIGITMGWLGSRLIPVKDNPKTVPAIEKDDDLNWGGDPDGQLAKALAKARQDSKKPRKPLEIVRLDSETFEADERKLVELLVEYYLPGDPEYINDILTEANMKIIKVKNVSSDFMLMSHWDKRLGGAYGDKGKFIELLVEYYLPSDPEYIKDLLTDANMKIIDMKEGAETFEAESDDIRYRGALRYDDDAENSHKYYAHVERNGEHFIVYGRLPDYGRAPTVVVKRQTAGKASENLSKKMRDGYYRFDDLILIRGEKMNENAKKLDALIRQAIEKKFPSQSPPKSEPKEEVKEETVEERDYNPYERMLRRRMKKGAETFENLNETNMKDLFMRLANNEIANFGEVSFYEGDNVLKINNSQELRNGLNSGKINRNMIFNYLDNEMSLSQMGAGNPILEYIDEYGAETFVAEDDDDDGFKPTNWNKIDGCKYCGDSWCDYLDGTGLCPVKHSDQMDAETFEQKIPPFTDNDMWTKWVNEEQNVYPLGAYGSGQSLLTPIKNGKPLKESGSIFNIPEEYFNFNYDSAKKIQIKWKEILKLAKKNDFVNWDESIYHLPTMKRAFKNLPKDTDIEIAIVNKYIPCRITFNYEGQDWYYSQSPYLEWWEQDEVKKLQRRMRDGIDKEPEFDPDFDPVKADRNKDGKISDWEKAVGNAVAKGIREHKEGKEAESFEAVVVNRGKQPKGALGKAVLNQRMIEQSKVMAILEELENKVRLGLVDEKQLMGDLKRRFGAESTPVTETDKYDEIASRFTLMELEIALVQTLNKKDMKSANEIMKVIQRKKFINEYQAENNEGR